MGVRGLTSFIARNAELYLKPYELHDCPLVIDGDNLACNLYRDVTGSYSAFGGDYDDFYRAVVEFFHVLAECNVTAYVLMDGGYEQRKLRTAAKRLRGKIAVIKRINPCGSITVFPLMMKEVFVDAVRDCGVPVMRCVFEADDELAALSRILNCPVLSYDSDFYIHNVQYIPLITLTVKAHTKQLKDLEQGDEQDQGTRRLRKNEAKQVEKRTKSNRILGEIQVDNVEKRAHKQGKTYKYLDCCMYRVENLIARGSLSKEKMPLFAALLGNDYIARSSFKNFFAAGMGKIGRSKKMKKQQRRIRVILQWLKDESSESALEKILVRLRKYQRESLQAQVRAATCGYSNELCHSFEYFNANYENVFKQLDESEEEVEEEDEQANEADVDGEEEVDISDDEGDECEEEDAIKEDADNIDDDDDEEDVSDDDEGEVEEDDEVEDKTKMFPAWFLEKLYPANIPRYCVDLLHLRKYINSPQIEHFPFNDCTEIALPILIYNFTLLNSVDGEETAPRLADDGSPLPIEFTYMTRATRVTNIRYVNYATGNAPRYAYNPANPNPLLLREVFEGKIKKNLNVDQLFEDVNKLPQDLQLYFLAIVYWLETSQHCDLLHLHSLIICLVVLRTIDSKIPAERDLKAFQKRYGKIVKKERLVRAKEALEGVKRTVKEELQQLPACERMPFIGKSDCYLVMDNLLKHFHMQEIFKKKYDLYSSTVLHGFAELQAVVFQLHCLNALLESPFESPHMGQLYCGVFLYNIYDLLRTRVDVRYHVQHFIFQDSPMMFDLYSYLMEWCDAFVPEWKRRQQEGTVQSVNKKAMRKQRQAARKLAAQTTDLAAADPNADMADLASDGAEEDEFFDLNNKFCTFLKVR